MILWRHKSAHKTFLRKESILETIAWSGAAATFAQEPELGEKLRYKESQEVFQIFIYRPLVFVITFSGLLFG